MADRILRGELLESPAWIGLGDHEAGNRARACWIACFLTVDSLGDMPAGVDRLGRLWLPYGVKNEPAVRDILRRLLEVDLARLYRVTTKLSTETVTKRYLYLPRFRQQRRYLGHCWPLNPWASDEEKQAYMKKPNAVLGEPLRTAEDHSEPQRGVDVGVDVGSSVSIPSISALEAQPPSEAQTESKPIEIPQGQNQPASTPPKGKPKANGAQEWKPATDAEILAKAHETGVTYPPGTTYAQIAALCRKALKTMP